MLSISYTLTRHLRVHGAVMFPWQVKKGGVPVMPQPDGMTRGRSGSLGPQLFHNLLQPRVSNDGIVAFRLT